MKTDITFILDRSGSMSSIAGDVNGGLKTFIKEQRKIEGDATFTLVHFDYEYEVVMENQDVRFVDIGAYEFTPRGSTALLDAVGRTINEAKARFKNSRPDKILFVIFTDGYENASREFNRSQIKTMIEKQQSEDWDFVFMGANQDSFTEAGQLGIQAGGIVNYTATPVGTEQAFKGMSANVGEYRTGTRSATNMFDGQTNISESSE
jgi:hypothetical protein